MWNSLTRPSREPGNLRPDCVVRRFQAPLVQPPPLRIVAQSKVQQSLADPAWGELGERLSQDLELPHGRSRTGGPFQCRRVNRLDRRIGGSQNPGAIQYRQRLRIAAEQRQCATVVIDRSHYLAEGPPPDAGIRPPPRSA
jgi:hypothetical protein